MSRTVRSRGFSLVELAIVIAAAAILFSVLTPVVMAVTDQTTRLRAERDAATLRDALLQLLQDTGAIRVRTAGEEGQLVYLLVSDGDTPTLGGGDAGWTRPLTANGVIDLLERHLVSNSPSGDPKPRWNLPSGPRAAGWRGAYLRGPIEADPWGGRYAVNVGFFGTHSDVVVLSAGPNRAVDSPYGESGFRALGDDIAVLVQ
ncbi:MAG: prepilin-type N-terminal cleavage/methylation domain-containing protein [Acidobacteria bacterium]|nr:prepilin-type N-terminal cleavage/methylation domain-containing protein [Acidobacteriota bacterium]